MARTQVSKEIAKEAIKNVILKAVKTRGKRFEIDMGRYAIIPKAITTREGLLLTFTDTVLDISPGEFESIIIDVLGLRKDKVTQLEIYASGTVVYSPGVGRDKNEVKRVVELLSQLDQI